MIAAFNPRLAPWMPAVWLSSALARSSSRALMPGLSMPRPNSEPFSAEFQLAVACSWRAPEPHAQDQIASIERLCRQGVDWDTFHGLVLHHEIGGIAHQLLVRHAKPWLPAAVEAKLKQASLIRGMRMLLIAGELKRVALECGRRDIPLIFLKGPVLSRHLFGDSTLRMSKDLDILIQPEDLEELEAWILAEGYQRMHPSRELTSRQRAYWKGKAQDFTFWHPGKQINLEVHFRFHGFSRREMDDLWQRSLPAEWEGVSGRWMDEDLLLITLLNHGARDYWKALKWLADVAILMGREPARDWEGMLSFANRLGCLEAALQGGLLCHWIYGLELPSAFRVRLQQGTSAHYLANKALQVLLRQRLKPASSLNRYLLHLRRPGHLPESLAQLNFSAGDIERINLPDRWFWVYTLVRPWSWLFRVGAAYCLPGLGLKTSGRSPRRKE